MLNSECLSIKRGERKGDWDSMKGSAKKKKKPAREENCIKKNKVKET